MRLTLPICMSLEAVERDIEAALATILLTEDEYRAERQGRVRRGRTRRQHYFGRFCTRGDCQIGGSVIHG